MKNCPILNIYQLTKSLVLTVIKFSKNKASFNFNKHSLILIPIEVNFLFYPISDPNFTKAYTKEF